MFVSFEGIDGSGKSTIIKRLEEYLNLNKIPVVVTKEPYDQQFKKAVLNKDFKVSAYTEMALFLADRADHITNVIQPALDQKQLVLCDRYMDSTVVYQHVIGDIPIDEILLANKIFCKSCIPNVTYYLDVYPQIAMQRIASRDASTYNKYDVSSYEQFTALKREYDYLTENYPHRIQRIDANLSEKMVCEIILADLMKRLPPLYKNRK